MSGFGYRHELEKYEEIDEDEILASLTSRELEELQKELDDMDPDDCVPIGLRQKDQTKERYSAGPEQAQEDEVSKEDSEEYESESEIEGGKSEKEEQTSDESEEGGSDEEEEEEGEFRNTAKTSDSQLSGTKVANKCNGHVDDGHSNDKGPAWHSRGPPESQLIPKVAAGGNPRVDIDEMLESVRSNDVARMEINLNNMENVSGETLVQFARAMETNTAVRSVTLANTHADDQAAIALADMLRVNRTITNLNVDSNFITGKGILAMVRALQNNEVLTELRFHNQRHICGAQVEMEMAKVLKENSTLLKLGYHFELPGPRMSMTAVLTRNLDKQRQKRLQDQRNQQLVEKQNGSEGAIDPRVTALHKDSSRFSPCASPKNSPHASPKVVKRLGVPPPPPPSPPLPPPPPPRPTQLTLTQPPPPPPLPKHKSPTRNIAEAIRRQEDTQTRWCNRQSPNRKKVKGRGHSKKQREEKQREENHVLRELKSSLKPITDHRPEEDSRPATPQRTRHDDLMFSIRSSSIKQLKRVSLPEYLR
eukprot:gi/632961623/ref/XP_007896857.1/ PREDICTED: leiomodin-2 [Callorhinchus milii]